MKIEIPEPSLVLLIGPSSSGKSTFAAKHFLPTEVISSDFCRGIVSDDEHDQSCSADAYEVLRKIVRTRLRRGKTVVVDATNTKYQDRKELIELAKRARLWAVAICFDLPEAVLFARHEAREDRDFGKGVVRRQLQNCRKGWRNLKKEGFKYTHWLKSEKDVDGVEIIRTKLPTDLKEESGPFDIIGDIHGCHDELVELLAKLGYERPTDAEAFVHPEGRRVIFVGDFCDRGPKNVAVLQVVRAMVEGGSAFAVRGNHDDKLGRYLWRTKLLEDCESCKMRLNHGLDGTIEELKSTNKNFLKTVREFVTSLPHNIVLDGGKLVVAHAGLKEDYHGRVGKKVEEYCLYGDVTGETDENGFPIRKDWAQEYRGAALIIYGHTVVEEAIWVNNTLCVDTGCAFGGSLTALQYPERDLVSVKAHKKYAEHGGPKKKKRDEYDLLDIKDVSGRRTITTRFGEKAQIDSRSAEAALDSMSRFTAAPNWLIYLPPTMSPCETASEGSYLEHPKEAFSYFASKGIEKVICQEKHMGSRAVIVLCKDPAAAKRHFKATMGEIGSIYSRTGRPMFVNEPDQERMFLEKLQAAVTRAGLWDELETEWLCIDAEFLPWSAKAKSLLQGTFAPAAAAGIPSLTKAVELLEKVNAEGAGELLSRYRAKLDCVQKYRKAYRQYCWHVDSLDDLKLAPFHLLASEGAVHHEKDHAWHLEMLGKLGRHEEDQWIVQTPRYVVDLSDAKQREAACKWWEIRTSEGSEGCVVKPLNWLTRYDKKMVQPAIKCRGPEYLRIIYGPEYQFAENLDRLRSRRLGMKRMKASKEYALGLEALTRFVTNEPLYRVHECVFAILAMESEPIDPRL